MREGPVRVLTGALAAFLLCLVGGSVLGAATGLLDVLYRARRRRRREGR